MLKDLLIKNTCITVPVIGCGDTYDNYYYYENQKNTKISLFSKCLLRLRFLRVFVLCCVLVFLRAILSWCEMCEISTQFTTSFLWTSLQFIHVLDLNFKLLNTCDYKLLTRTPSGALWLQDLWPDNNMCRCVRWIVGRCNDYKSMYCDQTFQDETKKKNLF